MWSHQRPTQHLDGTSNAAASAISLRTHFALRLAWPHGRTGDDRNCNYRISLAICHGTLVVGLPVTSQGTVVNLTLTPSARLWSSYAEGGATDFASFDCSRHDFTECRPLAVDKRWVHVCICKVRTCTIHVWTKYQRSPMSGPLPRTPPIDDFAPFRATIRTRSLTNKVE